VTILVVGRSGQLARALVRRAAANGVDVEALGRPEIDLEAPAGAVSLIAARRPRVVINAAAYTAVDKAEDERELVHRINAEGAEAIARAAAEVNARMIQISTDYVFSGEKTAPYREDDPTAPTGVYGVSKLLGEQLVLGAHPRAVVLRTAWVFDATGANFVRAVLRAARSRRIVDVVADQHGCPTFADDLADAVLAVAARPNQAGVYHCAGFGEASRAELAEAVFAHSRARGGPWADVRPIATANYPTRAPRPPNSCLDCGKLAVDYGLRMRPWREALAACMDEIANDRWSVG
jgi:dTDP-4-dehydrorhamnose reductase